MKKITVLLLITLLVMTPAVFSSVDLVEMSDGQGYVTADASKAFYYKYNLGVHLYKGWNLISTFAGSPGQILPSSEITANNIKAVYYYAPLQKQYVNWLSIFQGKTEMPTWWDSQDANIANGGAMWVYSNKEGDLKYWADAYKQRRILINGYNFVALSPEMGQIQRPGMYTFPVSFEQSGCTVKKVFGFDAQKQTWITVPDFETGGNAIGDESMGMGLVMKLSTNNEYCVWTPGFEEVTTPPSLPN